MELKELTGEHLLDAVDFSNEQVTVLCGGVSPGGNDAKRVGKRP